MKSKVWNKIFNKTKSSSSTNSKTSPEKESTTTYGAQISLSSPSCNDNDDDDGDLVRNNSNNKYIPNNENKKYNYEDSKISIKPGTSATLSRLDYHQDEMAINNNNKTSKISKMVNSFSLKRNGKKNKSITSSCNPDIAISIIRSNESTQLFNFEQLNKRSNSKNLDTSKKNGPLDLNNGIRSQGMDCLQSTTRSENKRTNNSSTVKFSELPLSDKPDYIKPLNNFTYQSEPIVMELKPCAICNRTFIPEKLEKHVKICEKWSTKKRKVFDSSRQRREGTEMEMAYLPKDFGLLSNKQSSPDTTSIPSTSSAALEHRVEMSSPGIYQNQISEDKSQQIHHPLKQKIVTANNGISAIKKSLSPTSRMTAVQIAEIKARAEAKRHIAPASEQCPECGRHFGVKAYDRHVEFCREKSKIAQFKGNNISQAKERLEARTKYRAPNLRLKRAAIRDKYSVNGDDGHDENRLDDFLSMSNSLSSSFMSDGGFSDKYDPFVSAKRQLEELCSPTSMAKTNYDEIKSPKTPLTPKNPVYSNIKNTSQQLLNSSTSSPMSTSYTGPSTTTSMNPTKKLNAVKSNFRRTSSLRAPRKSPPSRPIFVSSRSRPSTIQRGISDEGPISTNFIKPEEYDEMPVKSACINNFATSINSPRLKRDASPRPRLLSSSSRESSPKTFKRDPSPLVVRRNSNTNLNRRNLRLNLNNGEENLPSGVQKTDSLAVFLKYENELIKGFVDPHKNPENTIEISSSEAMQNTNPIPPHLVSEKDLKDKTNILSKQNSLKNSSSDLQVDKNFSFNYHSNEKDLKLSALKPISNNTDQHMNGRNINNFSSRPRTAEPYLSVNKILPVKLDPLPKSIVMKNSISSRSTSLKPSSPTTTQYNNTLAPLLPSIKPSNKNNLDSQVTDNNNINLTSIFFNNNNDSKDHNYIDPRLINPCDNLKVTPANSVDDIKSNWSQESNETTKIAPYNTNVRFLPKDGDNENIDFESFSSQTKRTQQGQCQDQLSTCSRNSVISEKSNKLFKRQIRLGKNQFLYDASPSDSESSPDLIETEQISDNHNMVNSNRNYHLNRSSKSSTIPTTTHTTNLSPINCAKEFDSLLSPNINPIFDNFDFEEFLATFENNNDCDDSFPGLKDCKEFLMNRCINMRSNNSFNKNLTTFHQYHNNNPCDSIRSQKLEEEQNIENKKRSQNEDEKHEIFISIETDQNENDETLDVNSCPSDPSIMKNPEVEEINGNDNKFTKIETYHLPIFEEDKDNTLVDFEIKSLPRSKLVKKLIREDNRNEHKTKDGRNFENIMDKTIESINSDLYPVDSDDVSSVEYCPSGRNNVKSKASSDSAYGSLSRNSPTSADRSVILRASVNGQDHLPSTSNMTSFEQEKILTNRNLNASSSGSENSLLTTKHSSSKDAIDSSNNSSNNCNTKLILSKFCYECGSKFLVSTAKFCMDCGVKRLAIE